jgi:hypothetical protein
LNWKEHAECPTPTERGWEVNECNADRAEMIAEGERLEESSRHYREICVELQAENARLREALVECLEWFRFDMHYGSKAHSKQAMSTMLAIISAALEVKP